MDSYLDQSYVRTLETSFRCYYNRTKKVTMPTPLNYTQAFLRITNPMLPGFRPPPPPPQFPTLFPPVLSHTPPPIHITPPPTIILPPPVQLSRITGLPPLPPPYPTLLLTPPPSNPVPLPITSRPHSLLYSTTVGTVYVPEISTTPNDPFVSPNSVMTTSITPIHPIDSGYSLSSQGLQTLSSATSAPVFSTIQSSTPSEQTMSPSTKKRGFGHVRGRGRTTTTTPSVGTTAKITHIKVGIVDVKEGNKTGKQELDMITNNNDVLEIFGNNVGIEEEDSNGRTIPLSHVDLSSKENEAGLVTFPHASPSDVTVSSRTSNYDIDLTQDVYGNLNPKFQATKHPLTGHSIADDRIQSAKSSSSETGVVHVTTESHLSMKNSSTDAAKNKTVLPPASGDVVQTAGRAAEDVSSSVSTGGAEASVQNKCLADLVDNSKKKYSNYECECPTGEWAVGRKCEAHETDMAFYKLDIHSACGENELTTEQKKWIAIGKIAEKLKIPSCARTTSAGNVIVNSFCGNHCTLKDFGDLTKESASDTRKVTIEEAPLCEESSTNYCHRYAICTVENVHLKCVCKKGTNDTSNGLGRICEGVPGDDDCIMILGACLIFWLIILLGLLLLVPLLIFLLSHCCPGRGNLIHPKKDGLNLHGKGSGTRSGAQESKHIAAIMSSLLEKNAGGTREMAMRMALAELKKREQEVEKTTTVPAQPKMARLEDAHVITPSKIINNPSANSITQISGNINGAPLMMKEISSIPGTVPAPYGETPILDKIPPPMIEVLKASTPDKSIGLADRNPLATTEPTFMPSVIVPGPKTEDTIQTSSALSSTVTERSERNHRLAEMLGVTLDDSSYSSSPTQEKPPERGTLDKTDDQIVEEMTLQGIMLPIPLTNEAELLRDEKIIETAPQITLPSHIESDVKTDSDADPVPILPALSVVPDVEVTESDSGKQESSQRKEKTATTSVVSNNAVFIPKKAREQQKEKESLKTSPNHRFATKSTIGSRQLLKPPERYMHSSTEESDPEVAVFKRLARTGRVKETIPLTRRKLRRPERQLSSISEKSAEIAAEAALQNQPQDYSISAPNTTRSITEWQRYVPKHTFSSADFSDTQTDVDIPKQTKKSTLTTKSKQVPQIQKKRKPSDQQLSKKRETKEIKPNIQGRQQLRPCQMPSTSTSVPKEPVKKAKRSTQSSSSPEIPDVTLRRSVHRLDLLDRSPNRNSRKEASTSGSQISAGTKFQRTSDLNREQQINIHVKQLKEKVEESPTWTSDYGTAVRMLRTRSLPKEEIPHTSRTVHHAVISRKIATRRHETHITKSTGDLTLEESCSLSSMDRVATISRSAENLHNRRRTWDSSACESDDKFDSLYSRPQWDYSPHKSEHRSENLYSRPHWDSSPYKSDGRSKNLDSRTQWDSSPHKPDDKFEMHQEPFLPQIKPTAKYYQKSRSVLNSPLGPHQRSSSKFSLTSLPARCSSTLEFSPYFTPGGDSDKPPKEDLWWGPAPRSFRFVRYLLLFDHMLSCFICSAVPYIPPWPYSS
ncbi:hypothetical protein NECAME_03213 [Necator americanus]|uniref:Uncharacterized protein n=1 Tax=Necator americanus TaxID=51031 RepID=W2T613_NECAM|nr:hypothetical protein NECAME_03213 [Necator americanus]ETN77313.1 hypothetical protein NECAME_03213 [Necator americanus]